MDFFGEEKSPTTWKKRQKIAGLVAANEVTDCHVAAGAACVAPTETMLAEVHHDEGQEQEPDG